MSDRKLFGISNSRAFRSVWAVEELGIDYEHVPTTFREDSKSDDYLQVNPNGRIPALQEGDFNLFESMAINLYLAKSSGSALYPSYPKAEALCWQWAVWGISEIEPLQMQIVVQKFFTPEDKRNPKAIASAERGLDRPLKVLDQALANNDYLLGSDFSIADLNLAGVMDLLGMIQFDTSGWANVDKWLKACRGRESYQKAKAVGQ
ncbi:MAG: glutathione S-transferase family protein [Pseudomonadota bacterium]